MRDQHENTDAIQHIYLLSLCATSHFTKVFEWVALEQQCLRIQQEQVVE
jgi:hypothetical protein